MIAAVVRAAALLARFGRYHRRDRSLDEVIELERFNARRIEYLALVLDESAFRALGDVEYLADSFSKAIRETKHSAMQLHGAAQFGADFEYASAGGRTVEARQSRQRTVGGIPRQFFECFVAGDILDHLLARRFAEHEQIEQRIGAETVGAVHRNARAFAGGVKTAHDFLVGTVRDVDLAVIIGGNASHLIVARRAYRYGSLC